MTDIMIPLKVI